MIQKVKEVKKINLRSCSAQLLSGHPNLGPRFLVSTQKRDVLPMIVQQISFTFTFRMSEDKNNKVRTVPVVVFQGAWSQKKHR
jgi:hypothetical protein